MTSYASLSNKTPIDMRFKAHVKTLRDCSNWKNPNGTIKHANEQLHFILWRILKQKIFSYQTWQKYLSSHTCFNEGGTDSFQPKKQSSTLRHVLWVLKFLFTPVLVEYSERWWAMKMMRQVQVYSMISNIVALSFINSGCSGKLKLRMHCLTNTVLKE